MRVVVPVEHRFERTPDGLVWTEALYLYDFWSRYLAVFDEVYVAARVRDVPCAGSDRVRADGQAVSFAAVPYYVGPWQYWRKRGAVRAAVRASVGPPDAVILRAPGTLATCLANAIRGSGRPHGVEVVGDPYDVFAPSGVKNPLRPFFRWWYPRELRRQCGGACAVGYVTAAVLQRRYPAAPGAFATHYSSVELDDNAYVTNARPRQTKQGAFEVLFIGSLAQLYKAPDVLIDAIANCVRDGLDLRLTMVGDGRFRPELEQRAAAHGLGERARFLGRLATGEPIRQQLDRADLFVLASQTEGLPRAMIEAMARAAPCVGSNVGGIPELLPPEDLVPPGDVAALAQMIKAVLGDPERMARMSARNLGKAREYRAETLRGRRTAMYRTVRRHTEAWLHSDRSP